MILYKKIFLAILLPFFLFSCGEDKGSTKRIEEIKVSPTKVSHSEIVRNPVSSNEPTDTINVAKFEFEETEYDFGTVYEGIPVRHTFKFKNVGKVPLLISDARSTCGCTVPQYPEEPIAPGEKGEIKVIFNTVRKLENQVKPVTLTANTYPAKTILKIKGYVHPQKTNPLKKGQDK